MRKKIQAGAIGPNIFQKPPKSIILLSPRLLAQTRSQTSLIHSKIVSTRRKGPRSTLKNRNFGKNRQFFKEQVTYQSPNFRLETIMEKILRALESSGTVRLLYFVKLGF